MADAEQKTSGMLKFVFRLLVNGGLVLFFQNTFPTFFLLQGGVRAIILTGFILALLNWLVVPILHVLSLPIKLFAWIIAFFLVNAASLWLAVWFMTALELEGLSLGIGGGFIGWLTLSFFLGIGNWLVRAILK